METSELIRQEEIAESLWKNVPVIKEIPASRDSVEVRLMEKIAALKDKCATIASTVAALSADL